MTIVPTLQSRARFQALRRFLEAGNWAWEAQHLIRRGHYGVPYLPQQGSAF